MDLWSYRSLETISARYFRSLAAFRISRRCGLSGGFALGLALIPCAALAGSDEDRALATRIKAAPDAITLTCNSPYDSNVVTISRKLKAMLSVTNGDEDDPSIVMDGVPLQGTVPEVAFDEDGMSWRWQSFLGSMSGRVDLRSLRMSRSGMGIDIQASCTRTKVRR
jgi:hypothetical protein